MITHKTKQPNIGLARKPYRLLKCLSRGCRENAPILKARILAALDYKLVDSVINHVFYSANLVIA